MIVNGTRLQGYNFPMDPTTLDFLPSQPLLHGNPPDHDKVDSTSQAIFPMASVLQPWSAFAKASPHFAKRFARCSAHGAKQPRLFRNFSTSPAQSRSGSQSIYAFAVRNCRGHSNTLGQSGQWRRVSQTATATVEDVVSAKKAWPKHSDKAVGYWLIGSAVSVFGIVVFGGLTRLSESGYATQVCRMEDLRSRIPFLD